MPSPTPTQAPAITEINLSLHYGVVQRGTNSRWNNSGNFKLWRMGWDDDDDDVQSHYTGYRIVHAQIALREGISLFDWGEKDLLLS